LQLAEVKPGEKVYDLRSGDGRIVLMSARQFGARATGVEIDPFRVFVSRLMLRVIGLGDRTTIVWSNFYDVDLSDAD
jgi:cyclopropane fatty-acyl-phospholipid synthase-like methyltransferase